MLARSDQFTIITDQGETMELDVPELLNILPLTEEQVLKARVLRTKMFLASTIGTIEYMFQSFLEKENICVGNYVDIKLLKRGGIYQLIFVYAKVVDD